jgi:hypothetical protein
MADLNEILAKYNELTDEDKKSFNELLSKSREKEKKKLTPESVLFDCEVDLTYINTLLEGTDIMLEELSEYFVCNPEKDQTMILGYFKRKGIVAETVRALLLTINKTIKENLKVMESII